jgi:hypothetical protein
MEIMGGIEVGSRDPFVRFGNEVEIFGGWMGMDADGIIVGAVFVEGVPFACL